MSLSTWMANINKRLAAWLNRKISSRIAQYKPTSTIPLNVESLLEKLDAEVGCSIPRILVPRDLDWKPVDAASFWKAGNAFIEEFLVQYGVKELAGIAPDGHGMVGFWGHGANSYAIYFGFRLGEVFIHLRLPFGGVYSDTREQRKQIARFLPIAATRVKRAMEERRSRVLIQSMGYGFLRETFLDGRVIEAEGNFLAHPKKLA